MINKIIALLMVMLLLGTATAETVFVIDLTIHKNDTVLVDVATGEGEPTPARTNWDDVTDYSISMYLENGSLFYKTYLSVNFIEYELMTVNTSFETLSYQRPVGELDSWQTEVRIPHSEDAKEFRVSHRGPIFIYRFEQRDDGRCQLGYDGTCDPDCTDLDPDCMGTTTSTSTILPTTVSTTTIEPEEGQDILGYLPYIIILIIAIVIIHRLRNKQQTARIEQKKKKDEEDLREWVEEQLRNGEDPELLRRALKRQGASPAVVDEIMDGL